MKKNIEKILLLLGFVLILSGCTIATPRPISYTFIGTFELQGRYWVITTEDSKIYKIKTTFLDLNPYIGKKVKVHGQFSKDVFFIDDVKLAQ